MSFDVREGNRRCWCASFQNQLVAAVFVKESLAYAEPTPFKSTCRVAKCARDYAPA